MLEKQSNWNSIQVLLNGCIVYRRTEVWDSTSASDSLLLRSEISTGWPLLRRWHLRWVEELIMSELRCHLLAATCHDLRLNSHDLCFISNLPQRWKSFRGCILPLITLGVFLTVRWDLDSRWTAFFGLFCVDTIRSFEITFDILREVSVKVLDLRWLHLVLVNDFDLISFLILHRVW